MLRSSATHPPWSLSGEGSLTFSDRGAGLESISPDLWILSTCIPRPWLPVSVLTCPALRLGLALAS